jgi:Holliday junction resolvase
MNKAKIIRHEVTKYLSSKGYSCHYEVGLNKWGKLRADIFAFNYKREVIVVEVKSGAQDYLKDKKWENYLEFSNKMFFAVDSNFKLNEKDDAEFKRKLKEFGVGLIVVNLSADLKKYHSKSVTCKVNSKRRKMSGSSKRDIIVRLAYRNGLLRTNKNSWLKQDLD